MKQLKRLVQSEMYAKEIQEICQSVEIKIYPIKVHNYPTIKLQGY